MGQEVTEYDPNDRKTYTRSTVDSGDIAKATASYDPRTTKVGIEAGAPKKSDFGAESDLGAMAKWNKAYTAWKRGQAQTKALGAGSDK